MTHPLHTTAVIAVFSRVSGLRAWNLITDRPDWNPALTDGLDADLAAYQFTDQDFGIAVTIMVFLTNGSRCTSEGYLIPTSGPCPLCSDRRHIDVRLDLGDTAAYAGATLHALLTEGEDAAKNVGIVDLRKPCPACRPAEYLLAADEHVEEVDL
jgi:hypothetical protein